ncbi:perlwapin-like [Watersipora subatra]|uniref:perlwapin-like n=1 Tax=Watersipora subatra TaxID=2589382 RepID=UPI00355BA58C
MRGSTLFLLALLALVILSCEGRHRRGHRRRSGKRGLLCPNFGFIAPPGPEVPRCTQDLQCRRQEKCCNKAGADVCVKGIKKRPKNPGRCPTRAEMGEDRPCLADIGGCVADSQCRRSEKCCRDFFCGYKICMRSQ